jgi:hypothetical protein
MKTKPMPRRKPLDVIDMTCKYQRQATVEILREGHTAGMLSEVADNVLAFAEGMRGIVFDRLPRGKPDRLRYLAKA